jgi:hypothetical protein
MGMDFIERWLGLSPDSGNGWYEAALLITLVVALAIGLLRRKRSS